MSQWSKRFWMEKLNIGPEESLEILCAVGRKMVEEEWTPQS